MFMVYLWVLWSYCITLLFDKGKLFSFINNNVILNEGTKSLEEEKTEVDGDLGKLRERYRAI